MNLKDLEIQQKDIAFSVESDELASLTVPSTKTVIGQPRAIAALHMGTEIKARGFNIFVTGMPGTGRRTAVLKVLSEYKNDKSRVIDIVYVYNFKKPQNPRVLYLPKGQGRVFKKDVHHAVENIKKVLDMQFTSDSFRKEQDKIIHDSEITENKQLSDFEAEIAAKGFQIIQVANDGQEATDIVPLLNGEASSFEELQNLVSQGKMKEEEFKEKRTLYYDYMDRMKKLFENLKRSRIGLESKLEELRSHTAKPFIVAEAEILCAKHSNERVQKWIHDFERDASTHIGLFIRSNAEDAGKHKTPLIRYGVNVVVDSQDVDKFPIIVEDHPTYANLFGSIEGSQDPQEDSRSAFLKIRAGSLIQASGGFLLLRAEDLLQDEESWTNLKRVLQSGKVEIQGQAGPFGPASIHVKPEAIEIDVKVIVIGNEMTYDALYNQDQDFQKLFKVSAEFDSSMARNNDSSAEYIAFIQKIVLDEGLLQVSKEGIAAVIEYGVRLSEYRNRLSTQFSRIADLLREGNYHALKKNKKEIDAEAITEAIEMRSYLYNLPEEKFQDMITSGAILMDVKGKAIGRVNGLAVHDRGYYAFGLPAVISAQVAPGESGVVNIEGESGLSGEIYDKAVLIVEGFLRSRYAKNFPLCVTASICFEQSYTAIEGDSASSTAVYALLSAIAGVPLRQDIAVTGSVNQMGLIQPVGGVTEKIEGFYSICKRTGFTGTHGVIIPKQNIINLTLSREVQDAIAKGTFKLWAVSTIDEGLELLSGIEAGTMDEKGAFPEKSFNGRVAKALKGMAELIRDYTN